MMKTDVEDEGAVEVRSRNRDQELMGCVLAGDDGVGRGVRRLGSGKGGR